MYSGTEEYHANTQMAKTEKRETTVVFVLFILEKLEKFESLECILDNKTPTKNNPIKRFWDSKRSVINK